MGNLETGLLLCSDLMESSRITTTAKAHGLTARAVRSTDALTTHLSPAIAAVILELDHSDFDVAELVAVIRANSAARIIAYGSHVNVERLKTARRAGCDMVMPRSQFVERLEQDLPAWLAG